MKEDSIVVMSSSSSQEKQQQQPQKQKQQQQQQIEETEDTDGDYVRIHWNAPGTERDNDGSGISSKNATLALKTAIAVARAFDANCALRNPAKECTVPMFESQELILGEQPIRSSNFFTDISLRGIKLTRNLQHGEFSEEEEEYRERFAGRSIDGHYAVKVRTCFRTSYNFFQVICACACASLFLLTPSVLLLRSFS